MRLPDYKNRIAIVEDLWEKLQDSYSYLENIDLHVDDDTNFSFYVNLTYKKKRLEISFDTYSLTVLIFKDIESTHFHEKLDDVPLNSEEIENAVRWLYYEEDK